VNSSIRIPLSSHAFLIVLLEHLPVAAYARSTSKAKLNTEVHWELPLSECVEVIVDSSDLTCAMQAFPHPVQGW
jgi:hypothetical protein